MSHQNLCQKGARYLKNKGIHPFHRCSYVVCDLNRIGECPDVFGWGSGSTQLIEVKVSRADFLKDKKKFWRINPWYGLGVFRSYLCPEGVINENDLPEAWGLLWVDKQGKITEIVKPKPQQSNSAEEINLVTSILRREGINPQIFKYKNYK